MRSSNSNLSAELEDLVFERLVGLIIDAAPNTPSGNAFLLAMKPWLEAQAEKLKGELT